MIGPEVQNQLHDRVLSGDSTASAELAGHLYDEIVRRVRRRFRSDQQIDVVLQSCADAFMNYIGRPDQFKPERGVSLLGYLVMSAKGDVLNLLDKQKRRQNREIATDDVEHRFVARNYEGQTPPYREEARETELKAAIGRLRLNRKGRQCLNLMIQGERSTERFAEILGLPDRNTVETRNHVKRVKDRIKKRIERSIGSD